MIPLQTYMKTINRQIVCVCLLIVLLGFPCTYAEPISTNVQNASTCDQKCGCDGIYIYDKVEDECVLNFRELMKKVVVRYDNQNDDAILAENGMARSIYIEGQTLFRGIMISVILFMTCAAVCVLSACIYCCRINYSDQKLKKELKAFAKKHHCNYNSKRQESKPKTTEPKSQSCNVVVEDAGLFVV